MIDIKDVVILGANGTMGAGSGEVFAAGGCDVVFLARSAEKAHEGLVTAQNMAKSARIADHISVGTYDQDLEEAVSKADLIFEALRIHSNNQSKAAKQLGLSERNLRYRLKKWGVK